VQNEREELRVDIPDQRPMLEQRLSLVNPAPFTGEGPNLESIAADYSAWKAAINLWFKGVKASGVRLSQDMELYHKLMFLKGPAILKAQDAINASEHPATWRDVESYLDSAYLGNVNPQAVIAMLKSIKQAPGQSVSEYVAKWEHVHRRLVNIGASNRDVAAQWLVDGLLPRIKSKVTEKLLEDQPLSAYDINDAIGAVKCVSNIALAKELSSRKDIVGETEPRWQPRGRGWHHSGGQRAASSVAQVNSMATDFAALLGVDNETIQQRLKAKVCLGCGAGGHQMRSCTKVRKAKLNSLVADIDNEEEKNE
jgi:hypothetical protein